MIAATNGAHPKEPDRMRWLWLGGSIVSDRDNPLVPTHRAVIRALQQLGQDVEYLEPADHAAFRDRLVDEGSGFHRAFLAEFPDIRYRRYDMPRSFERDVWLSREAALVDVLVVESGAPDAVFSWLERVDEASLVRLLVAESMHIDGSLFDLILAPDSDDLRYASVDSPESASSLARSLIQAVERQRSRSAAQD